jgi:hypothetical protein
MATIEDQDLYDGSWISWFASNPWYNRNLSQLLWKTSWFASNPWYAATPGKAQLGACVRFSRGAR